MKNHVTAIFMILVTGAPLLLCSCDVAPSANSVMSSRSDAFAFVVMGDNRPPHHASSKSVQPPQFYRAIDEINLLNPDFVVMGGDLIMGDTEEEAELAKQWDEFDAAADKLTVPYFQVIGNHDVSNAVMQRVYLERYGDRFPLFYSFDYQGCHFIILNSDVHGEYQNITGDQLAWLREDLRRHQHARKTFAFVHQPLFKNENSNWTKEVHPLLVKYGVDTVFASHLHRYMKFSDRDGIRHVVTGGAGAEFHTVEALGGFYHYCVVTVRGDDISIAVVKTGHIENENVVTEDMEQKVVASATLQMMGLGGAGNASDAPKSFDVVISNPFGEKLDGTLTWKALEGSPCQTSAAETTVSIEPGKEQTLTIPCDETTP